MSLPLFVPVPSSLFLPSHSFFTLTPLSPPPSLSSISLSHLKKRSQFPWQPIRERNKFNTSRVVRRVRVEGCRGGKGLLLEENKLFSQIKIVCRQRTPVLVQRLQSPPLAVSSPASVFLPKTPATLRRLIISPLPERKRHNQWLLKHFHRRWGSEFRTRHR